ncbi:MAG: hypothetical protein HYV63_09795 [Candidatus Schekmanbacteria bacterium]|nr:hypothetical protein [Candidatus Schekmanbacteria bacterium]
MPTSAAAAFSGSQSSTCVEANWSGSDTGAGVASYATYCAVDGGPVTLWLLRTTAASATFFGAAGRSYAFHSVRDTGRRRSELLGNVRTGPRA